MCCVCVIVLFDVRADENECDRVPSVCDSDAQCMNNDGSFTCRCNSGFTGNGTVCNGKYAHMLRTLFKGSMCGLYIKHVHGISLRKLCPL